MPESSPRVASGASRRRAQRFKEVTKAKAEGATYTPTLLARFVASQVVAAALPLPNRTLRVVDPACGDGELLLCLLEQLESVGRTDVAVFGFDTNDVALTLASKRIAERFPSATARLTHRDFLEYALSQNIGTADLFGSAVPAQLFDLLIANPPYVRTQILGADQAQQLACRFGLTGRVDLYHAFLLAIASVLEQSGTAGVIVSNRFMTTKGGGTLRRALASSLNIEHIWDLGDTKIFDAAVLPAVLLLHGKGRHKTCTPTRFTSIYATTAAHTATAGDVIEALSKDGVVRVRDGRAFKVQHGKLDPAGGIDSVWRISNDESEAWLGTVNKHTWKSFGSIGKIRVGIKTCADKIFIRDNWDELSESDRPELLRTLMTHHGARRFRARGTERARQVLYPHTSEDGRKVTLDLANYPRTSRYLYAHRETLESRKYVVEAGRKWYELWVPQDPALWAQPKLVFRDISEEPCFWVDLDGCVVNGDCYWLVAESKSNEALLWLAAAVGNSKFIEAFYDRRFNNKLYAGRRRFMTQYVEQFPIPDPSLPISKEIIRLSRQAYEQVDEATSNSTQNQINSLVWNAFGLSVEEVPR